MLPEVFLHSIQELRRPLLWWGLVLGLYTLGSMAAYPAAASQPGSGVVPALALASGQLNPTASPQAWMQAAGFALVFPILLSSMAVWAGTRLITIDEQSGALEMLLAYPLPRWRLILEKFAALVAGVFLLSAIVWGLLALAVVSLGLDVSLRYLLDACLGLALLALSFGALAFVVAAHTGQALEARLAAVTAIVLAYLAAAVWLHPLGFLRFLSPFYYASGVEPLVNGLPSGHLVLLAALIAVCVGAAWRGFEQRDLAV